MKTLSALSVCFALAFASPGHALVSPGHDDVESICSPLSDLKTSAEAHGLHWTTLSSDQWQFMRGMYAATPPQSGVPYGDGAAIVQQTRDGESGFVVFVDGKTACNKMGPLPSSVVKMILNLGTITHEGDGL